MDSGDHDNSDATLLDTILAVHVALDTMLRSHSIRSFTHVRNITFPLTDAVARLVPLLWDSHPGEASGMKAESKM